MKLGEIEYLITRKLTNFFIACYGLYPDNRDNKIGEKTNNDLRSSYRLHVCGPHCIGTR